MPQLTKTAEALDQFDREYPALVDEISRLLDRMAQIEDSLIRAYNAETSFALPNKIESVDTVRRAVRAWRDHLEKAKAAADPS